MNKKIDTYDVFSLSDTEIADVLNNITKQQQHAFFGDSVLRGFATFCLQQVGDVVEINDLRKRRSFIESNLTLTYFLFEGTNLFDKFNTTLTIDQVLVHALKWGTVVKAMLWRSHYLAGRSLLDLSPWLPVLSSIMSWVGDHLDFALLKEEHAVYFLQSEPVLSGVEAVMIFSSIRKLRPGMDPAATIVSVDAFIAPQPRSINSSMNRLQLASIEDILPSPGSGDYGHNWSTVDNHHRGIGGKHSNNTWRGSTCSACGAFNVIRKVSKAKSITVCLGFRECPGPQLWLLDYRRLLLEEWQRRGKIALANIITESDLVSWQFLEWSDLGMTAPQPPPVTTSNANANATVNKGSIYGPQGGDLPRSQLSNRQQQGEGKKNKKQKNQQQQSGQGQQQYFPNKVLILNQPQAQQLQGSTSTSTSTSNPSNLITASTLSAAAAAAAIAAVHVVEKNQLQSESQQLQQAQLASVPVATSSSSLLTSAHPLAQAIMNSSSSTAPLPSSFSSSTAPPPHTTTPNTDRSHPVTTSAPIDAGDMVRISVNHATDIMTSTAQATDPAAAASSAVTSTVTKNISVKKEPHEGQSQGYEPPQLAQLAPQLAAVQTQEAGNADTMMDIGFTIDATPDLTIPATVTHNDPNTSSSKKDKRGRKRSAAASAIVNIVTASASNKRGRVEEEEEEAAVDMIEAEANKADHGGAAEAAIPTQEAAATEAAKRDEN